MGKVQTFEQVSAELATLDAKIHNVGVDAGKALREITDVRAMVKNQGDEIAELNAEKATRAANNDALIAKVEENVRRAMRGSIADHDEQLRQTIIDIRTTQLAKAQAQSARSRVEVVGIVCAALIVVLGIVLKIPSEATIMLAGAVAFGGSRVSDLRKGNNGNSIPPPNHLNGNGH